jgi:hypothetical protein
MFLLSRYRGKILLILVTLLTMVFLSSHTLHAGFLDWLFGEKKVPKVTKSDDPSRDDLIRAVINHVSGKTYSKTTYKYLQKTRTCSQIDVDLDPYAKRNPELAKCPHVGATYWVSERIPVQKRYRCMTPPPPDHGWSVQKISSNKWRVSNSGATWDLTKISSKSVGVDVIYIEVRGSRNAFRIDAHQDC